MPTHTPQEYALRDSIVLMLAALHRVLLARCAAYAVSAGKPLTHALNRLTSDGQLVRHERLLPGGLTAYTVSASAALRLGVPRDRAELPTGAALDLAIAVQTFCFLGRRLRDRLTAEEAASLLGPAAPTNVPFILSDETGGPAVFRAVLVANRAPAEAIRYLRTLIEQGERHGALGAWIASRQLGFAMLAPTAPYASALERAIMRSRLSERAAVLVDVGPGAEHLSAHFKTAKGK
jgi:hypothetical protein